MLPVSQIMERACCKRNIWGLGQATVRVWICRASGSHRMPRVCILSVASFWNRVPQDFVALMNLVNLHPAQHSTWKYRRNQENQSGVVGGHHAPACANTDGHLRYALYFITEGEHLHRLIILRRPVVSDRMSL